MDTLPTDPVALLRLAYSVGGKLGALVGAVFLAINLYKSTLAQAMLFKLGLPQKYAWENLGLWSQRGAVFLSSLAGVSLVAVIAGATWPVALSGSVLVALGAAIAHRVSKVAGSALDGVLIAINPEYAPGAVRKMVGVVLPSPKPAEPKA